ncbi:MAG: prepilin-type N-terminal cleavage/methylation domain-containing protein [Pseudomonadota bacterium]
MSIPSTKPKTQATAKNRAAAGFTLLELLVVISILAVAAFVAVSGLEQDDGQWRLDETRNRIERIRSAIVGDSDLRVNGAPAISGFATDVGALPPCLAALVDQAGTCGGVAFDYPAYQVDGATGLGSGWRGPYLSVATEITTGLRAIRDGWGNTSEGDDAENFGWSRFDTTGGNVVIQSIGADLIPNTASAAEYAALDFFSRDYPPSPAASPADAPDPIIIPEDYQVDISNVPVTLWNGTTGDSEELDLSFCLRLTYPDPDSGVAAGELSVSTVEAAGAFVGVIPAFSSMTVNVTFADPPPVTSGLRQWQLILATAGVCSATGEPFNGHTPQLVTLLPRSGLPGLTWTAGVEPPTGGEGEGEGEGEGDAGGDGTGEGDTGGGDTGGGDTGGGDTGGGDTGGGAI